MNQPLSDAEIEQLWEPFQSGSTDRPEPVGPLTEDEVADLLQDDRR